MPKASRVCGPDVTQLTKRGIAFARAHTECYTKEATVNCTEEGDWRLFYEYEEGGRSRIGLAIGDGPSNHWHEGKDPMMARDGMWDCWHLSTGPLIIRPGEDPLMFYNGSDRDARWSIGWATFSHDCLSLKHRCETPLIGPPPIARSSATKLSACSMQAMPTLALLLLYFSLTESRSAPTL